MLEEDAILRVGGQRIDVCAGWMITRLSAHNDTISEGLGETDYSSWIGKHRKCKEKVKDHIRHALGQIYITVASTGSFRQRRKVKGEIRLLLLIVDRGVYANAKRMNGSEEGSMLE